MLYGNQFSSPSPDERKFIRGKTPEGAKLPPGPKAVVSDLPGETKRITFYQISTQISLKDPKLQSEECTKDHLSKKEILPQENTPASNNIIPDDTKEKVSLVLIDLPGYGFAYTSDERMQEWRDLMHDFLVDRGHMLKRILLLIDARHGFKKADFDFLETLQQSLGSRTRLDDEPSSFVNRESRNGKNQVKRNTLPPIQIILTKCDLVKQVDLARRVVQVRRQLSDSLVRESEGKTLPVMLVCAKAGLGFNNIRGSTARGGILELQRELASIAPRPKLLRKLINNNKSAMPSLDERRELPSIAPRPKLIRKLMNSKKSTMSSLDERRELPSIAPRPKLIRKLINNKKSVVRSLDHKIKRH